MFDKNDKLGILALFIVVISVFYLGTTVPSTETKFLDFFVRLVSLMASFATIFAVYLAYLTYQRFIFTITHPGQFDIDKETFDKLKSIHSQCEHFSDIKCNTIMHLLYSFKDCRANECPISSDLLEDWTELVAYRSKEINETLSLQFNEGVFYSSNLPFNDLNEAPKEIKDYQKALKNYVHIASRVCSGTKPAQHMLRSLPYIDRHSTIEVEDLCISGKLFRDLDSAFVAVRELYKKRWPTNL